MFVSATTSVFMCVLVTLRVVCACMNVHVCVSVRARVYTCVECESMCVHECVGDWCACMCTSVHVCECEHGSVHVGVLVTKCGVRVREHMSVCMCVLVTVV